MFAFNSSAAALLAMLAASGLMGDTFAAMLTAQATSVNATLTVTKSGSGAGTVTSNVGAINCGVTCNDDYTTGTAITLTATPDGGNQFTGWLGPCTGNGNCQFTINSDTTAAATFAPAALGPPTLDIDGNAGFTTPTDGMLVIRYLFGLTGAAMIDGAVGPGATRSTATQIGNYLTDIQPALDIDGNGQADALTDGLLIIRYLLGLRGDGLITGAVGPGAIRANFADIETQIQSVLTVTPAYALSVNMTGTGSGTVTCSPAGLNCGADCAENYISGTNVALAATGDTGSTFSGWGDACAGTGACNVTMDAGKSVSATFTLDTMVPPPADPTVATSIFAATTFLYTGANPIQTGVAPGTIEDRRAAVLRGTVHARDGAALSGVTITILAHPEFGQTQSRANGAFDLAVNGGGLLTVNYQKTGFFPVQRQVNVPWQDYAVLADVVMVEPDSQVTTIDLNAAGQIQVAQGSPVTDGDGTRQATMMFPVGTQATLVMPDGSTQPLTTLNVRATEYTVGPTGPSAMPGALPPTSWYTYAVELSADEALAAGASEVRFSSPLPFYVENFLGFPVGIDVPLGSYDRASGLWVPADSGRVIKVLSVTAGLADLDITGDGLADSGAALLALSITDAERQQLAGLYQPGQSLWRVLIPHFTPWDHNWPYVPPPDALFPVDDPIPEQPLNEACEQAGSIIDCQNQTLGEVVGAVGTPFGLRYQSELVPGRKAAYQLEIPLSGDPVPGSLRQIELEIQVAGRLFQKSFAPTPNQRTTFTWDGRDTYGRTLQGRQPVTVRIGYTYGAVYGRTTRFGSAAVSMITGSRARQELTLWRTWDDRIGSWDAQAVGLGGWNISAHHVYDAAGKLLVRGDGRRQSTNALGPFISTFAGTISTCAAGDGGQAILAGVCPRALVAGPDGSVYITQNLVNTVRRVGPDGIITRTVGTGAACSPATAPCGDNGPAAQAQLNAPWSIAIGPDRSLYIADLGIHRVRKVRPDGIMITIAGTGVAGFGGDDGPATQAQLGSIVSVAVGPDNSIYIAEQDSYRIRRVGSDGTITTVAGSGQQCVPGNAPCGDGGPAIQARLSGPGTVAVGRDGSLYIGDISRLRRVGPDGIISTIAGTGVGGSTGDGGPATQAHLGAISALAVGSDDTIYLAQDTFRVRWMRVNGTINMLAGSFRGTSGDGGLAPQARLDGVHGLAIGSDGSVYVAESAGANQQRVRRIAAIAAGGWTGGFIVPSAEGSEVYVFDPSGRHLRTLDAPTGAARYDFTYDSASRLATITDGNGNVTTIERNASGGPTAIVSAFGQRTGLETNADGYLSRVTSPAGDVVQLAYTSDGLLTDLTNPLGQVSHYTHDLLGRLTSATDPTGATKTLARTGTNQAYTVTVTSPLGRVTTYGVEHLGNGDIRLTTTDAAGNQLQAVIGKNGSQTATHPDGTTINRVLGPDPRWGMQAPVVTSMTFTSPGGRVLTRTSQRAATLTNPSDLLSLSTMTETVTVNGRVFASTYNAASRTFTRTAPTGRQSTLVVDVRGMPLQAQFGGLAARSFTYDPKGRLATATHGSGAGSRTTTLAYGANGFLQSVTDAASRTLGLARDANGRITEETLPDGGLVSFSYDANGNVTTLTPPGQPDHTFAYDQRNQISAYTAPVVGAQNSQTLNTYDADRQPLQVVRPDSQTVGFQYDSAGRPSLVDIALGDLQYGYDMAGRLGTLDRDQGAALAYAYDGGLPTGTIWSGAIAGSVTGVYDNNFRVTSLSVNDNNPIALSYDLDGLLIQTGSLTLARNAQNGLITGTTLGTVTDTMTYDAFGSPASYTANQSGSEVYSTIYARDMLGRIATRSETIGGITHGFSYTYDLAGWLTDVREDNVLVATYTYDGNGNRLSRTDGGGTTNATYDAQDRLDQFGSTTYVHSANGERLSKTIAGQATTYQYDGAGNLTGVTLSGGPSITYVLDGRQRRVGKKLDGTLVQGFLYQNGLKPIAELDGSNNVVSRFVYSHRNNVPAYMIKAGITYRIVADHLGSPRLVIDTASGSIVQRLDYDEFGNVTLDTSPGFQPFGFAGGIYDAETRLVRFGARNYDAETGRWITKDPIGFNGGVNLYSYADNDPVNLIDPLGDSPVDPFGSTGAGPPPGLNTAGSSGDALLQGAAQAEADRVQAWVRSDTRNFYSTLDARNFNGSIHSEESISFGTNQVSGTVGGDRRINLESCPTPPGATGGLGFAAGFRYWAARGMTLAAELEPWVWAAVFVDFLTDGALFAPFGVWDDFKQYQMEVTSLPITINLPD